MDERSFRKHTKESLEQFNAKLIESQQNNRDVFRAVGKKILDVDQTLSRSRRETRELGDRIESIEVQQQSLCHKDAVAELERKINDRLKRNSTRTAICVGLCFAIAIVAAWLF